MILSLWLAGSRSSEAACPPRVFRDDLGRPTAALEKGCRAPYAGILIDETKIRELGQKAERAALELDITITSTRAYWREVIRHKDAEHAIELDAANAKTAAAVERLPAWYERPAFTIPLTVLLTFGAVLGSVEVYKAISPEK